MTVIDPPDGPGTVTRPDDLRELDCAAVLVHASHHLSLRLLPDSVVRKRRTLSGPTDRGTWLRIECRTRRRVETQGWGGVESAAALTGIAKPDWYRALSWRDRRHDVWWRADETELVDEPTISASGPVVTDPGLDRRWWDALGRSLTALAPQQAPGFAKLGAVTASPDHIAELANRSARLLGVGDVDTCVTEWVTAHADLTWANLTAPRCRLLDWEDWGRAPRGFDAATLLLHTLAIPEVTEQVRHTFAADLATHSAKVAILALSADPLSHPGYAGSLLEPVSRLARQAAVALSR